MIVTPDRRRHATRALGILVPGLLLVIALRRLDLRRAMMEVAHANPPWLLAALLCFAAILPLWATQWWVLLASAPRRTLRGLLRVVAMTSSVLNTTPMLVGEAAGVHFLTRETGVDRASGLAVLAMDQLFVGLAKVAVISAAASLLPLPDVMREGLHALWAGVALLLVLLLLLAWSSATQQHELADRLPARLGSLVLRASASLAPLRSPGRAGGALLLALAKKACELLAILAVQHAFGVDLPAASSLLVLAALNLATLLPVVPGNVGIFEAAVVFAYGRLGVPVERALGMAVVQHACYFMALALPGYPALLRATPPRSVAAIP